MCRYDVAASSDFDLDVDVRCDPGVQSLSPMGSGLHRYLSDVHGTRSAGGFKGGYRLALGRMAREEQSIDSALAVGDSILVVGTAWLLPPDRGDADYGVLEVRVTMPQGMGFDTGQPLKDGVFEVPADELGHAGFSAFGVFRRDRLEAAGDAGYRVVLLDGALDVGHEALLDWVGSMTGAVTAFWHGFPAPGMPIYVVPREGETGVPFGRVMAGGGVSLVLYVGEHATPAELRDDWVLIHELVHAGFPFVPRAPWFLEGLSTYLEPVIRARYRLQTPEMMWTEFMTFMPRGAAVMEQVGLARGGFRGWYWGGALFMLLADVEMRLASGGRVGLEDCLRRIRSDVGDYRRTLELKVVVELCDAVAGGRRMHELIQAHVFQAGNVDIEGLWRDIGLRLRDGELSYIDDAPLSEIRRAIIRGGTRAD